MRTIVISGSRSGVGKTHLAKQLLRYFPNWSALKVTTIKGNNCPHERSCGICSEIQEPFSIIKDEKVINQAGKDTYRLKKAGAKQVIWLRAKPEGLKRGLEKVLAEFYDCEGIIIEGTSVLRFIRPDLNIHLYGKGKYKIC